LQSPSGELFVYLYDTGGGGLPINWDAIYFPTVFSTSSAAIAASSSLWGAYSTSSYSQVVCGDSNFFYEAICKAAQFLLVANPAVMNVLGEFPALILNQFPFNWIVGIQDALDTLPSSAGTETTLDISLSGMDFASSTAFGSIFGSAHLQFSSSTVMQYINSTLWGVGQALIAAGLWLALAFDMYATLRNKFTTTV